ncbi:MAG: biotin transporter BioY [Verrucomicrobia bacterium]|nr:biotin transporter BioY [Verrucomicrobiota bacterium]
MMEYIAQSVHERQRDLSHALGGSLFLALCSCIWLPTLPIAITLQTFALFILALTLPRHICLRLTLFYLLEASIGLPVLGSVSPLWFLGPSAGYLFAFPAASYIMSSLAYQQPSLFMQFIGLVSGLLLIYGLGFLVLIHFVPIACAFQSGVLFFLPIDLIKIGVAMAAVHSLKKI